MGIGPAEEEVLGYHRLTQETQPREVVYEEEVISVEDLDRVINIPEFFVSAPTRWELKATVKWREGVPPEDVYIGGQVGQRIHAAPDPYQPGDFLDIFGQRAEEEEVRHTPELSVQGHREILRNIEDAGEVSSFWLTPGRVTGISQGQLPGETEGAPAEGRVEARGARVLEGSRSSVNEEGHQFGGDGLPQ